MSRYTTIFLIVIVAILLSLIFYQIPLDFSHKQESDIKKIYFADNMTSAHFKLIKNFNHKHQGEIEVVPINLPFEKFTTNERKELIARSLRNKNSKIDIFTVDCISVSRFAKWAEPLEPYLTEKDRRGILPEALKAEEQANQWVSIPLHVDIGVLFYRKDYVNRIDPSGELENKIKNSISWQELINLHKDVEPEKPFYLFQGYNYEGLICNLAEMTGSIERDVVSQLFENLNSKPIKQSSQFLHDLIYKYKISPSAVTGYDEAAVYAHAIDENIPFFRGWPGFLREIDNVSGGKAVKKNIGLAPLPHFNEKAAMFGGWNLMMSKSSEHKREASLFLKYILTDEAQRILFREAGYLPIKATLYSDEKLLADYPYLKDLRQMMTNWIYRPYIPNYTVKSDILSNSINSMLKQQVSIDEGVQRASDKIQDVSRSKYGANYK